ncbi:1,2-dihydroxy-3-keto-5-methylthiopentene dioxygenase [Klebsiella pneumoniae]|uniref:1,2-dihydroxy-3-keto-5-methylthiopentene dioxygenase n=2 Tax=Klebsiella pneumoniae TaxID=573 RepID=A0A377Z669_KLEPO|nr:1,2-dihydroxy-3-keto-5-methylthiopentene dioxygenase [Klebsiella pneumoniae]STU61915.1 1,2-dihydroxy-3-keto-5-methylthiopentene dioxygenase [Klebsiella pneumoniae subsp. ozaenae]VFS41328.1 Acireductone dioxygenase (Fe(2+)-requiring) [Serratia liquefaciens]SQC26652.1 1,2-dihydroxy-3-keto-5-methylthiopentene dioxygenase [Klebsiella pneumoniae]STR96744.1 1,2-dihydroxy-3-keto-5-methylthiopentene dioxygenase [Klebsiella pneumoniae]
MSALTLFSVTDPQTPVWHSTDAKAIQDQLNAKGVRFERWQADRDLGANPSPETVIAAYQHAIDKLVAEKGNDSNLLIVFYVQIMPDDLVMQLHRF